MEDAGLGELDVLKKSASLHVSARQALNWPRLAGPQRQAASLGSGQRFRACLKMAQVCWDDCQMGKKTCVRFCRCSRRIEDSLLDPILLFLLVPTPKAGVLKSTSL